MCVQEGESRRFIAPPARALWVPPESGHRNILLVISLSEVDCCGMHLSNSLVLLDALEKHQWPQMTLITAVTVRGMGGRVCGMESTLEKKRAGEAKTT